MKVRHNKVLGSGKWWRLQHKAVPKHRKAIAYVDGKFIYA